MKWKGVHIDVDSAAPNEPLEKVGEVDVPPSMDLGKGRLYPAAVVKESISKVDCAEDSLSAGNVGGYLNFGQASSVAAGRWLKSTHRHSRTLFRSRCCHCKKERGRGDLCSSGFHRRCSDCESGRRWYQI